MPNEKKDDFEREVKAAQYWDGDIAESRMEPSLAEDMRPAVLSEDLIRSVDEFLAAGEIQSAEELDEVIRKLDTASAINNDPKAKELRAEIFERYGR